jgi:16S rRNA (cytosine1402-N4)-methyltransferase
MIKEHIPVMLNEIIKNLNIKKDGIYVDLTLGYGGHSKAILEKLSNKGFLVSFDKDQEAIKESRKKLLKLDKNFKIIYSDFKKIKEKLNEINIKKIDGIIADLGISSPQINKISRGFSYSKDAKLDMRMDQNQDLNAHKIVNNYSEIQLTNIFKKYGETNFANKISKNIIKNRPINTTFELVQLIRKSLPAKIVRKKNPAKAIFQAIRIEVNQELESLKKMLSDSPKLLNKNGTLSIITFHSLEDKIVKNYFKKFIEDKTGKLPIIIEKK